MKTITIKRMIWAIVTLAVVLITFLFSAQASKESDSISMIFARICFSISESMIYLIKNSSETELLIHLNLFIRKISHMFIYLIMGFSIYKIYSYFIKNTSKIFIFTFLSCIVLAAFDELHQYFVDGRTASISDVFIDMAGVSLMLITIFIFKVYKRYVIRKYEEEQSSGVI